MCSCQTLGGNKGDLRSFLGGVEDPRRARRYKPWGEVRYTWKAKTSTTPPYIMPKYTFTGQYSNVNDFGLMFYNARWYDPILGRFAQADSIVPGGVQGLDRYAYANNNPLHYTDPSGHCAVGFILGLFGISYSCPTDGGTWIEGFDPVHEDIGLEINVPVEEVTNLEGFDPVPEDDWIEGFDPAPEDNGLEGFDPAPDNGQLKIIAQNEDDPYPHVIDPRTGEPIPEPADGLQIVPKEDRVPWDSRQDRKNFIKEWHDRGYKRPEGGWDNYDIHHIIPREYGGDNDFWNLVPVNRNVHWNELNPWWQRYGDR